MAVTSSDRPLRQGPAHRPAELVDVAAGPGEQVARPGRLDDADGQREGVADEVLAQLGEHLLAQHLADVAGVAGEHGLQHEEPGQHHDDPVDLGRGGAASTASTRSPSSRGAARPASAASDVQRQRSAQQSRGCRRAMHAGVAPRTGTAVRNGRASVLIVVGTSLSPGDRRGGTAGRCRAGPGDVRSRRPGPRAGTRPRPPRRASAGCSMVTTVVRPTRCSRSRAAIRASVWASTAEVGSTSTRISGSRVSARASTSRCRWPPEKVRPRSATTVSRPSGSPSRMSAAEAVSQGARATSPCR